MNALCYKKSDVRAGVWALLSSLQLPFEYVVFTAEGNHGLKWTASSSKTDDLAIKYGLCRGPLDPGEYSSPAAASGSPPLGGGYIGDSPMKSPVIFNIFFLCYDNF